MVKYVRQSKEEARKARLRKALIITLVIAVILAAAVVFFRQRVQDKFASGNTREVETAAVTVGSIKTTVSGSGSLTSEGVLDVELPALVELEDTLVEAGENVEQGQMLATVSVSSVLSTLKQLQEELEDLDKDLENASNDTAGAYISAGVTGRVKAIFVEKGDDVSAAMAEHGALMLLSMDGCMAVDIPAGGFHTGDKVDVAVSDGIVYEGSVSKVADGTATILITDNGPLYADTVTVNGETGTLYIHESVKVTGYAGSVKYINVKENARVSRSTSLLTLDDTSYSANYDKLLSDRAEMEKLYQALVKMYQDGGIRAEVAGTIQSIEQAGDSADTACDVLDTLVIMTLDPNETVSVTINVDETDIQSLDVGQEASVTVGSIGEDVFTGTVSEINKTATSSSGVTAYTATITLDKTDAMLSGMTADVAVTIEGVENALLVPEDAVRKTSATSYVYMAYDAETGELGAMAEVTTGLSNGAYTEITSGLKEGDTVYYTKKENSFSFGFAMPVGGGGFGFSSGAAAPMMPSRGDGVGMPGGFPG